MKNQKLVSSLWSLTTLIMACLMTPAFIQAQTAVDQNPATPNQIAKDPRKESREDAATVVKSYSLKYIPPSDLYNRLTSIIQRVVNVNDNVVTIEVLKTRVRELDELIQKFDVEKKRILLRIYTVLASRKTPDDASLKAFSMTASTDDPDLKRVLDELKGLWNFKSYRVESPSFMTVKDGSGSNFLRLISDIMPYNLIIMHPKVRGDEPGKRIIFISQIQLKEPSSDKSGGSTLIDAEDFTLKEKGILVVGVGGMPMVGAVILIISAEIK